MTKVTIEPGICGFVARVEAASEDQTEVKLKVSSGCKTVMGMMKELGDTFDAYELCLTKPGTGPLYDYASRNFPVHVSCPVIAGIIKCAEVECKLALPKDAGIHFE
jgi:hypothetical protein